MTQRVPASEWPSNARIRIGISSWTDLPGFYPSGIKAGDRLTWYSRHFNVLEINVSFYRIVPPHTYLNWLEQTPASLVFDIKAFRELTHERHSSPAAVFKEFRESVEPLRNDGRLGGILFQFPPGFTNSPASRAYVAALPERMPGEQIVVEFRHASWLDEGRMAATLELLRAGGITLAVVDEPWIPPHTVPLVPAVTNPDLSYLRLHGRNAQGWFGGREHRYAYDYSMSELEEVSGIVRTLAKQTRQVHVLFNNNSTGAGTVNAQQLAKMLGVSSLTVPEQPLRQAPLLEIP